MLGCSGGQCAQLWDMDSLKARVANILMPMQGTVLMALLQPAPEVYGLFDDILLMAESHVVYHGPKEDVLPFFERLGFRLPPRKGIGDFLQEASTTPHVSMHQRRLVPSSSALAMWTAQYTVHSWQVQPQAVIVHACLLCR